MRPRVLIVGGNFGGLSAAVAVTQELGDLVDVTVVSAADHFLFTPSLIRLPFGDWRREDVTFPLAPTLDTHGVRFVHATATRIDTEAQVVETPDTSHAYDYLVIATGHRTQLDVVPGLTPDNGIYTVTTLEDATRAAQGWQELLDDPGPVVVGATKGASFLVPAYEFLLEVAHQLTSKGLRDQVDLTYVAPEPFVDHVGTTDATGDEVRLLGTFLRNHGIRAIGAAEIVEAAPGKLRLADGQTLDFAYAVIIPPLVGQDVVKAVPGLTDAKGFVVVHPTCQSVAYPNVYAVGVAAVAHPDPLTTPVPIGVPRTVFRTEVQAKVVAADIATTVREVGGG